MVHPSQSPLANQPPQSLVLDPPPPYTPLDPLVQPVAPNAQSESDNSDQVASSIF